MPTGLIARKDGMSQVFLESGECVPVTYLKIEPNTVVRTKCKEKDGYDAIVLGIGQKTWKSRKGKEHVRFSVQKEWRVDALGELKIGAQLTAEVIPTDAMVTITGVSKGKGFQGVMKRHHFAGGPASRGSHFKREPGSIGMRTRPGRVLKGHPMAGHMGTDTVTRKHMKVVAADAVAGVIAVNGPVPGPRGAAVYVTLESSPDKKS